MSPRVGSSRSGPRNCAQLGNALGGTNYNALTTALQTCQNWKQSVLKNPGPARPSSIPVITYNPQTVKMKGTVVSNPLMPRSTTATALISPVHCPCRSETRPIPLSCLQRGGSLGSLPAECQRNPVPYLAGVVLLGVGVGVLWRFVNQK